MVSPLDSLDTKPYVVSDPLLGYRYKPESRLRLPRPGGGVYDLAINAAGIRADRDYGAVKPAGVRRIVVLGDSMAAGQFVSNSQRFSELLERRVPGLEVINLALEGSGTDQQILIYEQVGLQYEHDLVLLLPFLQNIRRNMAQAREAIDPRTGRRTLRPKPWFELQGGNLLLHPPRLGPLDAERPLRLDEEKRLTTALKARVSRWRAAPFLRRLLSAASPWEPFPEYRSPEGAAWRLMAALIGRLRALAMPRPVVIVPTFYSGYVQFRMARNYWKRFWSLSDPPGLSVIDLLPHFERVGADAVRCFQDPFDPHFSVYGHMVLADALEAELSARGLLATGAAPGPNE